MSKVVDIVKQNVVPIIQKMGYEVVDVEYKSLYNTQTLIIYIHSDREGGTNLEDCEAVHYVVDPILDELDPTSGQPYHLNISSPGLDRPFKNASDFNRNMGKEVEVKLYKPLNDKKVFEGILRAYRCESGEIDIEVDKTIKTFLIKDTALIRQLIKF